MGVRCECSHWNQICHKKIGHDDDYSKRFHCFSLHKRLQDDVSRSLQGTLQVSILLQGVQIRKHLMFSEYSLIDSRVFFSLNFVMTILTSRRVQRSVVSAQYQLFGRQPLQQTRVITASSAGPRKLFLCSLLEARTESCSEKPESLQCDNRKQYTVASVARETLS